MKTKTVLISGAGVAGLTLAYWLKQFGMTPTLVEKHPCLRTGGYKIDLRGSGLEVLKRMGIYPAISASRTAIPRAICIDQEGHQVTEKLSLLAWSMLGWVKWKTNCKGLKAMP